MNIFYITVHSTLHRYTGDCSTWYSHQVPAVKQLWVHIDSPPAVRSLSQRCTACNALI